MEAFYAEGKMVDRVSLDSLPGSMARVIRYVSPGDREGHQDRIYPVFQPEGGEHLAADEVRIELNQLSACNQSVSGATAAGGAE